jgi:beta-galactosidase
MRFLLSVLVSLFSALLMSALLLQCTVNKNQVIKKDWSKTYRIESGTPFSLALTVYSTTMIADGKDHMMARVAVTDSIGKEIISSNLQFRIYITGDATLSGESITYKNIDENDRYWEGRLTDGLCRFNVIAGTKPDKIKLEVKADSLHPSSHEIHTVPADFRQMHPTRAQLSTTGKPIDRMLGADISFLPQTEERGARYIVNGEETDAVEALAENGFNYIRLRIFVNPENPEGYSPEKGFCGLDHAKLMAKRVKESGMKLLLNFHYSDYWADPQQQNKPLAWHELGYQQLKETVKKYTKDVLLELGEQGTLPDMVQVGNEINHGILWPEGHISNPDQLAGLLMAGAEAVNEVDPDIPVMMHLALGGQNAEAVFWLDNMIARGVRFDIIGLSYYPRWHGTLDDLQDNLSDLADRYALPLNIVEYLPYPEELNEIIFSLPDDLGKGTCTWEPLRSMFGRDGVANDNLFVYKKISVTWFNKTE